MSESDLSAWIEAGAEIHPLSECSSARARLPRPLGGQASASPAVSSQGPLGTNWEIGQPPPLNIDAASFSKSILTRIERYHLQAVAREIMLNLEDEKGRKFAIRTCLRSVQAERKVVGVHRKDGKGFYSNLQTCGSVWVCPVCAAKISEVRRRELSLGIERWKQLGGDVKHLILTVRHHKGQSLKEVLDGIGKGRKLMRNRKPWKKKLSPFLAGSVRALEVTYGDNGWHVHVHELLFIKPGLNFVEWLKCNRAMGEIWFMWRDACIAVGLGEPDPVHGVMIQNGQYAAAYAAKWGLDYELTKAHIKETRGYGGHTPWDMLREYKEGNKAFKGLFAEYAVAFKGKRQLVWSEGLKGLLGVEDVSDEELAAREEVGDELLGFLDLDVWRQVLKAKKRGELAAIAGAYGWDGVQSFIRKLRQEDACNGSG